MHICIYPNTIGSLLGPRYTGPFYKFINNLKEKKMKNNKDQVSSLRNLAIWGILGMVVSVTIFVGIAKHQNSTRASVHQTLSEQFWKSMTMETENGYILVSLKVPEPTRITAEEANQVVKFIQLDPSVLQIMLLTGKPLKIEISEYDGHTLTYISRKP